MTQQMALQKEMFKEVDMDKMEGNFMFFIIMIYIYYKIRYD